MGLRIKLKFKESHRDTFVPPDKRFLKSIFWNWTNECNNRCDYCYLSGGLPKERELNTEECKQAIKIMSDAGVRTIVLAGGEPLIRKDHKELIDEIYDRGFEIKMCSNGYFLDREMLSYLESRNVVGLQIALEALDEKTYNQIKRPTYPNTFKRVMDGIDLAVKECSMHNIISTVPVQTNKNQIKDMIAWCRDKGIETLSLYKIIPYGKILENKGLIIPEDEFLDLMDKWIEDFVSHTPKWILETEPPYAQASGRLKKYENRIPIHYSGCKAGITLLSVMPSGEITPCHAADKDVFYCGHILKDDLKDVWENHPLLDYFNGKFKPDGCEPCKDWDSCLGGCRVAAYGLKGDLKSKDPFCDYWINI